MSLNYTIQSYQFSGVTFAYNHQHYYLQLYLCNIIHHINKIFTDEHSRFNILPILSFPQIVLFPLKSVRTVRYLNITGSCNNLQADRFLFFRSGTRLRVKRSTFNSSPRRITNSCASNFLYDHHGFTKVLRFAYSKLMWQCKITGTLVWSIANFKRYKWQLHRYAKRSEHTIPDFVNVPWYSVE